MQPKSELDMYLEENFESTEESFDILIWWRTHAEKYPVLSTMARDFLAIPLSTVCHLNQHSVVVEGLWEILDAR